MPQKLPQRKKSLAAAGSAPLERRVATLATSSASVAESAKAESAKNASLSSFEQVVPLTSSGRVDEAGSHLLEDYVTVVVTPKLSFQMVRSPDWVTVQDITQEELRRGFLSRFPPALWMSSRKFSFKCALPEAAVLTPEMKTIVFKLTSDEVADERVLLGILQDLERSYEGIIRRAVNETRSEALQEQVLLQEQAEVAKREQDRRLAELQKENKCAREQLQSMQKRLFLMEQEKDNVKREQHDLKEYVTKLERARSAETSQFHAEQQAMREELDAMRALLQNLVASTSVSARGVEAADADSANGTRNFCVAVETGGEMAGSGALASGVSRSEAAGSIKSVPRADSHCQTEAAQVVLSRAQRWSDMDESSSEEEIKRRECDGLSELRLTSIQRQVDQLQADLGSMKRWLQEGSQLFRTGAAT